MIKIIILGFILLGLSGCETLTPYQQFSEATKEGDTSTASKMLKEGYRETYDWMPGAQLSRAVEYGRKDILELMLDAGYSIDSLGTSRETALQNAAIRGNIDIVKLLLSRNANPNIMDKCGRIPLGEADIRIAKAQNESEKVKYMEISKLLKSKGATYNIKDEYGNTSLLKAFSDYDKCHYDQNDMAKYYKYDINAVDDMGNTIYHLARYPAEQKIFEAKGANPNIRNKQGYIPSAYWSVLLGNARADAEFQAKQYAKRQAEIEKQQAEQNARDMADLQGNRGGYWQMNADASKRDLENMQKADALRRNADYRRQNNCSAGDTRAECR